MNFYLGIDVSKGYADFVIIDEKKQLAIENFQLDDSFESHNRLYVMLQEFLAQHPKSTLYAAMESTGGYENNWYNSLSKFQATLNIKTARLNPLGVVYNSKAELKRNNTDKISAQNVAEYLVAHPEKVIYMQSDPMASLRKQWGFIQMLTKQSTQFRNQLNSLLYSAHPELLTFCRDGIPDWLLKLLIDYPTADQVKKARGKTLAKIPYVTMERAQQLVANAKRSVASATDNVSAQLVSATAQQVLHLKKMISVQTDLMAQTCDLPEVTLLKTFVGIGDKSAIGIVLEIGSVARFKSPKKLASFWGVHPVYKTSGDGSSGFKMSKQGRKAPRKILFNVALSAIEKNPVIRPLYEYHLKQGRKKMDAIGICMHKILRIIYGMLKNNTAFDSRIDRANRQRMMPSKTINGGTVRIRRFESYDPYAPISRRQHKKRVEQEQSQSVKDAKCGI